MLLWNKKPKTFQSVVNGSKSQLIWLSTQANTDVSHGRQGELMAECERACLFVCSRLGQSWGQSCGARSVQAAGLSRGSGCPAGLLVCSCGRPSGKPSLQSQARWAKQPTVRTATGTWLEIWLRFRRCFNNQDHTCIYIYLSYSKLVIESRVVQAKL